MKYSLRRTVSVTIGLALLSVFPTHMLSAQTANPVAQPNAGVTVAPAFSNVQIGSKQPQADFSVGIRNDFDSAITLNASLSGLAVKQNSLTPGSDPESVLNQLTTITPSFIQLKPKESINIKVTIKDSAELSPGGHYASLLIRQISATPRQVAIEPAISTTIYIIKEDGAVRKVGINSINTSHSLFSLPKYTDIDFKNQGNVAIVPRGVVTITKGKGDQVIAQSVINAQSVPLFQSESTKLRTDLVAYEKPKLPGKYTMKVQYSYENQSGSSVATSTFWYIPKPYLLIPLLIVLALYFRISKGARKLALRVWDAATGLLTNRSFYKRWAAQRKPKKRPVVFQMSMPNSLKKYSFAKIIPITFIESTNQIKTVNKPSQNSVKKSPKKKISVAVGEQPKKTKKVTVKLED